VSYDYSYGENAARMLYGQDARHVPAWLYVQNQGSGLVSFVGASAAKDSSGVHPLRYQHPDYEHVFVVGEIIVRPHLAIATNALAGSGLGGLATVDHDIEAMLRQGKMVAGFPASLEKLLRGQQS
jgi:hypothetical protein